ncbi:MAG: heme exporter protein CcmB [Leadbetterella sp.]
MALIRKDFTLEWRQKSSLSGMVVYMIASVYLCYMSFRLKNQQIDIQTWNTLFWIILLFTAFNSISRSFLQEKDGRFYYLYQIAKPESIILGKIFYNIVLLLFLGLLGFVFYTFFMGQMAQNFVQYLLAVALGSIGFSCTLTLMAALASKTDNSASIMGVVSFPVILPVIIMLIRFSKNAMDGLNLSSSYDEIAYLLGIDLAVIALSFILFPFIWKS